MLDSIDFKAYARADREGCLRIFAANSPAFFAPNERDDYAQFLDSDPDAYEVCLIEDRVVGAFGLFRKGEEICSLNWIMIDPESQGLGVGTAIMERVSVLGRSGGMHSISIAASHKSAPFFARFGAVAEQVTDNGWGPGMHRVDMTLSLLQDDDDR